MPVGELFLGAFLQVLFEKLASGLVLAFARRQRIYKLLKKWNQTLHMIHALVEDAEDKQLTDKSVKLWLEHLRDLAYDLDDVLDEISTTAHVQESKAHNQNTCSKFVSIEAFMFKKRMKSKIENISIRLDDSRNGNILNLSRNIAGLTNQPIIIRLPSTSVVEPYVCGRDRDKEEVCRIMIQHQENDNVCIIPIVGMGGIGKTTLAQLIYNDEMMSSGFDLKVWVCVSEVFDVLAITKTIFHSVTQASPESNDLNLLQESLQQMLSNKKFFLILDDLWNESYVMWDVFFRPFLVGLPGSKILVTTRNKEIAMMVGSVPFYQLNLLTDEDCLSLLAQHALGKRDFDKHPDLTRIGEALARKCRGLPLAAKTLGGLLRAKKSPQEWEGILCSKIWNLPRENNILPVLRLSYHHLPLHLKHLFAYCSIFPKDYEFEKYELVLLWMGEGFIPEPSDSGTKEQLGCEWFDELLSRSFFQRVSNIASLFVMHDLINDLAQFVAGGICYKLDENSEINYEYRVPGKARHASFLRHEYEVFKKFAGFYQVRGLRTFLPMPVQNVHVWPPFYLSNRILTELLPKLNSLRVLSLSGYSVTELPASICALIHLRYLNLSGTSIVTLPHSLSELYNLETLSVRNCRFISKLPPAVGDLINLRHLDNANTDQLKELPVEIKKLINLQSLPKVVLSKDMIIRLGLKDLRNLELLRGSISLLELQNVTDIEDAKEASLWRKKDIEELQLAWANDTDSQRDTRLEEKVLDELQPHEYLKKLKIEFYGGLRFPSWIGDPSFLNIFSVSLTGCNKCTSLPPLGMLPELKHLRIGDMPGIKQIWADGPFPKLETLRFEQLPNWDEWSCLKHMIHFPSLRQLTLFKCPKLASVSRLSLPVLNHLDLEECNMAVIKSVRDLNSLNYLKVEAVAGLSHLPVELVQLIVNIEVIECCNCNNLTTVWPNGITLQHLTRLKRLVVADCSQFVCIFSEEDENDWQQKLPENLEILELFRCSNLTSLPNGLKSLASLRELIIKNCPKIISFPENAIPRALKRLEILSCKALESLPNDVSKLERLEIKECPSLKNWWHGNFPNWLKKLSIKKCNKLDQITENMFPTNKRISLDELSIWDWRSVDSLLQHVHKFSRLSELYLSNCDRLEYFPEQGLPPYLRTLSVEHCSNLRCLPIQIKNMRSIVSLEIRSCRRLRSFPRCDFPPNLTSLRIWDSRKLEPLSRWGLHRLLFLEEFSVCGGFQDLELLSNDERLFPPSLIKLSMARLPKLSSLSKVLESLRFLQHLSIMNCTSLDVLPSENVLEKLWHLEISDCPLLKQRCLKDKGDYWTKIAGIPCVEIDGTYIYKECSHA